MEHIPQITGSGKHTKLLVHGRPFHARAGELRNSSASSLEYLEERVWPALRGMHMNCVLAPVYWECVEPEEGVFDFTLLDGLLAQARREHMKLILLWFALWKNAASTYVPAWVKRNTEDYWYVSGAGGRELTWARGLSTRTISPLCRKAVEADARAFARVMAHLRGVDGAQSTVIAVQVENEIGMLGTDRDYGPEAEASYARAVPDALARALGVGGSWKEAFGAYGPEAFMAWHFACAVRTIMEAGRREYPLPMFVNAWLEDGEAGNYPSGGPQAKNRAVWRAAAPGAACFAPDIYVNYFREVCEEYTAEGSALLIPETRATADAVPHFLYAVGEHNTLCYAPFGIEDAAAHIDGSDPKVLAMLAISPDAFAATEQTAALLSSVYASVESIEELIERAHDEGRIRGFLVYDRVRGRERVRMHSADLEIVYGAKGSNNRPGPKGGGLVIELDDCEFLVLAVNCSVRFLLPDDRTGGLDLIRKEEGRFSGGAWVRGRILNGDERARHVFGQEASFLRFLFHPYPKRSSVCMEADSAASVHKNLTQEEMS